MVSLPVHVRETSTLRVGYQFAYLWRDGPTTASCQAGFPAVPGALGPVVVWLL